ncbi:HK97 gp10 family phage protein [Thermogutta sp.]|uniref:HK97 gp10 family phage protein n=1 Tax=Thermogutta sp. TaxID=1962930 RepID=UPI00321FD140
MFRVDVRVTAKSESVAKELDDQVNRILGWGAGEMLRDIKGPGTANQYGVYRHACPYKTGNLRESYMAEVLGRHDFRVRNDAQIAHYAVYQEFGPRPHFRAAFEYWAELVRSKLESLGR